LSCVNVVKEELQRWRSEDEVSFCICNSFSFLFLFRHITDRGHSYLIF
jgi:hypothetical protein